MAKYHSIFDDGEAFGDEEDDNYDDETGGDLLRFPEDFDESTYDEEEGEDPWADRPESGDDEEE
ncbi:MAG: hypothetical protein WBA12_06100 [Catalinimonas sp.]